MRLRRIAGRSVLALLLALTFAVVDGASPTLGMFADAPPPGATSGHVVLALGDSVPSGHACDCQPFPETYGSLLSTTIGAPVRVNNRAVGGLDTSGLLEQLRSSDLRSAVRTSDVILVTIGANDFGDHHDQVVDGDCGRRDTDCVRDELQSMRSRLATALARIDSLRRGSSTTVLVTGYWNVFQDGDVARRAYGEAGLQASLRLTRRANAAIRSAAAAAGARYVDLYQPFEESGRDVTSLMAADGDHPDAAGHALIAQTLLQSGLPG
jgi:lysophospholipase L1-like esterase